MTRRLALLFACLALGLVAAGCGEDDAVGGEAASPATEVSMEGIKFNPTEVTVEVGDTVSWVNDESIGHDVTADDFQSGEPGGMEGGATFEHTFDSAGTFDYVCSVHPGMKGTVTVK
jgi:plastocyanin